MENLKFAIIGAGAGGQSMAAILADKGYSVKLQDVDKRVVEELNRLDNIILMGKYEIMAKPELITTDAMEAIKGADIIMVVTTANSHEAVAESIARYIGPNQIIILNPGFIGGSLSFQNSLKKNGCSHDILVAETSDLMYTCRIQKTGMIFHSGLKKSMDIAAVPASRTQDIIDMIGEIFPILSPAESILHTGFKHCGAILHSIPMILNVNRIDKKEDFEYYMEGMTPTVAKIAEKVDLERVEIARAFNIDIPTTRENVSISYGAVGNNLYEVIQNNKAYSGVKAPSSLSHRFLVEDTFGSLVPLASIAKEIGIPTPGMDAIISLISLATDVDYAKEGRTAEKLGIGGKTIEEIYKIIL